MVQEASRFTAAVFLNYRTPLETVRAVRSLRASTTSVASVIVVDNASQDGSADFLRRELSNVRLLVADTNGGFSAGCNIGIREARRLGADRVLLLNSDVVVKADADGALERALDRDATLGIVGPILVSSANPDLVESIGIRYRETTSRMRHAGFGSRLSRLGRFEQRHVDGVSGSAMLIRCAVFDRIGLFEEEYFFGFEDLDFCLRAHAAGFRTACVGTAIVEHEGNLSIGRQSPRRIYFATRNHLRLAQRFAPRRSFPFRWLQTASVISLNAARVVVSSDVPRRQAVPAFLRGIRDHFAGRYGPALEDSAATRR